MGKRRNSRRILRTRISTLLVYGSAIAAGAVLLQWLEYHRLVMSHSGDIGMGLLAALFLGLGIWIGAQLFSGKHATAEDAGNPAARDALGISAREHEVLELLACGLSNKEIASRLSVSPNTVKTHVARLLEKLEARRRTEAIQKARQLGIVN